MFGVSHQLPEECLPLENKFSEQCLPYVVDFTKPLAIQQQTNTAFSYPQSCGAAELDLQCPEGTDYPKSKNYCESG